MVSASASSAAVPVFFLSDSTGISAETMGNALLIQFPGRQFERTLIPFISSVEEAREVVARLDAALDAGRSTPLVFTTAADDEVRQELRRTRCPMIDFFDLHMEHGRGRCWAPAAAQAAARLHGVGDIKRYNTRMRRSSTPSSTTTGRACARWTRPTSILIAPSRCGKTPTTMYLALQHGLFVANYPLVDEDLEHPRPARGRSRQLRRRCFGLVDHDRRGFSQVRNERRPELPVRLPRAVRLRAAPGRGACTRRNDLPVINSSTKSVEEMSTIILQTAARQAPTRPRTTDAKRQPMS